MSERTIFLQAIEIADPADRQAYLDQACQGDASLREQVESLLKTHEETSQFLETPAVSFDSADQATVVHDSTDDREEREPETTTAELELKKYLDPPTREGWLGRLGHYEIEEILGRGAFGIVAKAFDERLHRVVAIKMLSPELATTSPPRKRFLREARSAAAVQQENIVAIHAVEEEPIPYLVMEYIPGPTLQQRMDTKGPLEMSEILRIGRQIASGLAAAHAVNLIHRDIKPSNILLTDGPQERVKISDFGLARAVDDASMTSSGMIAGTPMYMAPEQARGETLDHRADLFSLGSVLYQMASGRPPFRAANTVAVLKRVCDNAPRPLTDVIPETPAWLSTIIFRLLEKDRDDRFQTAQEVADLLAQCERELERDGKVSSVAGTVTKESVARRTKKEAEKTASKGVVTGILMMLAAVVLAMVIGPQVSRLFDTPIPSLPPVESGIGLKFDGKDDYVEVTGLDWNYPQFTIEAFVTSAPGSDNGTIAFLGSGRNDDREWMSLFDGPQVGPGKRISGAAIKGKTEYENAYGPFTGGERQHRALVFDGRSLNYYINGIWQGQRKAEPHEGLQWKMKVLRLGCDGSGRKFFQGVIDQLRVSRVARYSENFEVHVDLASDDQTLAMYRFDEREGARLRDLSGNGHDGKIVGAKWVQPIPSIVSANPSEFALQFDGVDDFALLPIKLGMVGRYLPDRPFTYEAFFTAHRQRQEVEQNALAKNALPPPLAPGVLGFFRIGGVTYIPGKHLSDWVESKQIFSDSPISENKEHHVAMVWDGQAMQMFVDGIKQRLGRTDVPRQSSESWSEFDDAAFSLCGMRTNLGFVNTFAGTIREVRISTTARYMEDFVPEHRLTPDGDTIGLYHCDDGSGDTLIDSSGQNHHGKIVGATWVHPDVSNSPVATSKPSFALQFDGVDDHVAIDSDIMGKTSSFTVEAIVTFPGNYQNAYILSGSGKDFQFGLGEINGQRGFLVRRDHNLTPQAHATDRINNQSVHVAGVWDGSTASFFLNGQRVDQGVNKQGLVPIGDRWGIGCLFDHDDQGTRFFQGTIHEIRISNYPRYDENFPPKTQFASDSRTLALYHFDEGQGNVLKDSSGNGHDGKIIGATWVPLEVRPSTGQQEFKWSNHWPNDAPAPAIAPFTADEARAHQEAWAQYLGVPVEYENSIGMKFRLIPPGEFLMGSTPEEIEAALKVAGEDEAWRERINSEAPQHKVVLTQPVYVGVTEVTQAQYERVMGTNPSHFSTTGDGKEAVANLETGNHPVEMVSWNDAAEFCAKLSVQEKLKPFYFRSGETITPLDGTGYRLPTEAEWESACRAGTTTRFWSGDEDQDLLSAGWFSSNSGGRTHAAGELRANPFGLSDIHGNVWEWVQDSWDPAFYGKSEGDTAVDPYSLFYAGSQRVVRGGDWYVSPSYCRSSGRLAYHPWFRNCGIGFRVVLVAESVKQQLAHKRPDLPKPETTTWHDWPADAPPPAIAPFSADMAKAHQEAWAKYLGVPVEYTNSIGMKFRIMPPGEFLMGSTPEEIEAALKVAGEDGAWRERIKSEAPQHKVVLTQPVYVGVTEVTQAQYEQVMGTNPSYFSATGEGKDAVANLETGNHPVEMVSWNDAVEFCAKLSQQEELKPFYFRSGETITPLDGTGYRLPTEAEWEFACRAGTTTKFSSGNEENDLVLVGWYGSNSRGRTHAVGELQRNPFGMADVHGNVWEWVEDSWDPVSYKKFQQNTAINPRSIRPTGSQGVFRGGAWNNDPARCRSPIRHAHPPMDRHNHLGLRVVLPFEAVK